MFPWNCQLPSQPKPQMVDLRWRFDSFHLSSVFACMRVGLWNRACSLGYCWTRPAVASPGRPNPDASFPAFKMYPWHDPAKIWSHFLWTQWWLQNLPKKMGYLWQSGSDRYWGSLLSHDSQHTIQSLSDRPPPTRENQWIALISGITLLQIFIGTVTRFDGGISKWQRELWRAWTWMTCNRPSEICSLFHTLSLTLKMNTILCSVCWTRLIILLVIWIAKLTDILTVKFCSLLKEDCLHLIGCAQGISLDKRSGIFHKPNCLSYLHYDSMSAPYIL